MLRRLTAVDTDLASCLNGLFDEGTEWDHEQGNAFLRHPDNLFLGAFWDDVLCGFLTAHRLQRFDQRRAEVLLYEIGVQEDYRNRGIGKKLIAEAERWAAEVGADELWVLTNRSNLPAMALYRSTGRREDDAPDITMFTYRIPPG